MERHDRDKLIEELPRRVYEFPWAATLSQVTVRRVRKLSLTPTALRLLPEYELARKQAMADTSRECSQEELHRAVETLERVSTCIDVTPPAEPGCGRGVL
jgi:hypothetical protein